MIWLERIGDQIACGTGHNRKKYQHKEITAHTRGALNRKQSSMVDDDEDDEEEEHDEHCTVRYHNPVFQIRKLFVTITGLLFWGLFCLVMIIICGLGNKKNFLISLLPLDVPLCSISIYVLCTVQNVEIPLQELRGIYSVKTNVDGDNQEPTCDQACTKR